MKKFFTIILCLLPLVAWGQYIDVDGIRYTVFYDSSTNTECVKVGQQNIYNIYGEINIPETIMETNPDSLLYGETFTVVEIGYMAFDGCNNITSVSLPKTVKTIGRLSFAHCPNLKSISLSEGLATIGIQAFEKSGVTSLEIPASVEEIGDNNDGICGGCASLEQIVVREGNARYDSRNNCNAIIETGTNKLISGCKNTTIVDGIETIGKGAFQGCSGLTSVHIPASVKSITNAFGNNFYLGEGFGLVSITVDSDNPVYDSRNDCNAIISTANDSLILGCVNTIIPDDIKVIGGSAFSGCSALKSIEIPSKVVKIYPSAFNCENLRTITCHNTTPPTIYENTFIYLYYGYSAEQGGMHGGWVALDRRIYDEAILYVPKGCVPKYKEAEYWKKFRFIAEIGGEPSYHSKSELDFTGGEEEGEDFDLDYYVVEEYGFDLYMYNLKYQNNEGCICIKNTLTDGQLEEMISKGYEDNIWKAAYSGTVLRAKKGTGVLKVTAKTPGNRVLKVKIGNQQPIVKQVGEREYFEIPYSSDKDCSVYFYSDEAPTSNAKLRSTDEMVKIYSLGWDIIYDPYAVSSNGDVNQDSQVTFADVTALLAIILDKDNGDTPLYDHDAADVNGDGEVTIADVTALVNRLTGKKIFNSP